MEALAARIAEHFLWLDESTLHELGIIAVVLSGSVLYCHAENDTLDHARDLDMAMIAPSVPALAALLGPKRPKLMRILRMANEESLHNPWPANIRWQHVDGVRFAGFDAAGLKRSAKIITLQALDRGTGIINVLSKKDRRVYEGFSFAGLAVRRLQPATKINGGLVVLHDPWLFETSHRGRDSIRNQHAAAFGVTADLLLTGFWFRGERPVGQRIRQTLVDFASKRTGTPLHPNAITFARSPRFGQVY